MDGKPLQLDSRLNPFPFIVDFQVDGALETFAESQKKAQPFFLYFQPTVPHSPLVDDALVYGNVR